MAKRRGKRHLRGADWGEIEGFGMDDWGDFGDPEGRAHVTGPLVGGGAATVGIFVAKLLGKGKPIAHWSGGLGFLLGAVTSGILMARPRTRAMGLSGLITAALVGIPRQLEDLMAQGTMKGYLGVITPEREMYGAEEGMEGVTTAEQEMMGQVSRDVQLLDSGSGSTGVLGTIVPEQEMAGAGGDIELLGAGGFGSNFFANA